MDFASSAIFYTNITNKYRNMPIELNLFKGGVSCVLFVIEINV